MDGNPGACQNAVAERDSVVKIQILCACAALDRRPERWFEMDAADAAAQLDAAISVHNAQVEQLKQVRAELGLQRESVRSGLARKDCLDDLELRYRTLAVQMARWPERIADLEVRHRTALERLGVWRRRCR